MPEQYTLNFDAPPASEAKSKPANKAERICPSCKKSVLVDQAYAQSERGKKALCMSCRSVKSNTTHGGKGTRLYNIWKAMRQRCYYEKGARYADYGGRGIRICPEWDDFQIFKDWAEQNGYADNLSIDRKDNNGNYEPSNCQWATQSQQSLNRRKYSLPKKVYTDEILQKITELREQGLTFKQIATALQLGSPDGESLRLAYQRGKK